MIDKKWYLSKTLWANTLAIVAGLALWASEVMAAGGALTAIGAINVMLRLITSKKLI